MDVGISGQQENGIGQGGCGCVKAGQQEKQWLFCKFSLYNKLNNRLVGSCNLGGYNLVDFFSVPRGRFLANRFGVLYYRLCGNLHKVVVFLCGKKNTSTGNVSINYGYERFTSDELVRCLIKSSKRLTKKKKSLGKKMPSPMYGNIFGNTTNRNKCSKWKKV